MREELREAEYYLERYANNPTHSLAAVTSVLPVRRATVDLPSDAGVAVSFADGISLCFRLRRRHAFECWSTNDWRLYQREVAALWTRIAQGACLTRAIRAQHLTLAARVDRGGIGFPEFWGGVDALEPIERLRDQEGNSRTLRQRPTDTVDIAALNMRWEVDAAEIAVANAQWADAVRSRWSELFDRTLSAALLNQAWWHYEPDCNADDAAADARGLVLLKAWLSPAQLAQYEKNRCFEVRGSDTGKCYRISHGRTMNIVELDRAGEPARTWCFLPEGVLVAGDVMLAQKIALETREREALAIANAFVIDREWSARFPSGYSLA